MAVDSTGYRVWTGEKHDLVKEAKVDREWETNGHMQNFLDACRSRKSADLNAEIEIGHLSSAMCHMANISYRVGRKLTIDPKTEKFTGDDEANKLVTRSYRAPYVVPEKV